MSQCFPFVKRGLRRASATEKTIVYHDPVCLQGASRHLRITAYRVGQLAYLDVQIFIGVPSRQTAFALPFHFVVPGPGLARAVGKIYPGGGIALRVRPGHAKRNARVFGSARKHIEATGQCNGIVKTLRQVGGRTFDKGLSAKILVQR